MPDTINLIIYPVSDVDRAKRVYQELLGVEPVVDQPYYVQFEVGGQQIGLDPNGHRKGLTGPVGYREVEDVKASLQRLLDAGGELQEDVRGVGGGKLTALVKDGSGNIVGLLQTP